MKVPLKWLLELCPIEADVDKIADILTLSGSEVENIEDISRRIKGIVVGKVESLIENDPLPGMYNCKVKYGDGKFAKVLSRAPNIEIGAMYPFAPAGSMIFGDQEIGIAEFEGIKSEGMLCSGKEIGLGEPSEVLLKLPRETEMGKDITELLRWDDVVFEFEITPNRPDCYGILGLARELSALTGTPLADEYRMPMESGASASDFIDIQIEDPLSCPRYSARIIENIQVGPSPLRIMGRLNACGLRPINNIVDSTNYIMLLLSHPLHAFDYDKLNANKIIVRNAKQGEKFITLDDQKRTLKSSHLLITTPDAPLAIAGVMGGADSEIDSDTTRVLLESAYFNPAQIRMASRQQGITSESSIRFERGVDPNGTIRAGDECAALISYTSGGEVRRGTVDNYTKPIDPCIIQLEQERVTSVLGIDISEKDYSSYLNSLGMKKADNGWEIPTYRPDIQRGIDIIEEIGRLHGYDRIKPATTTSGPIPAKWPFENRFAKKASNILIGLGFNEVMTPSLGKGDDYKLFCLDEIARVANPISLDFDVLRSSLLPGLLTVAHYNLNREENSVRVFEYDKIYSKVDNEYIEKTNIGVVLAGDIAGDEWYRNSRPADFFDFKGIVESFLRVVDLEYEFYPLDSEIFDKAEAFEIHDKDGNEIGRMGKFAKEIVEQYDIEAPIFGMEIDVEAFKEQFQKIKIFKGLPKYPSMRRDVALIVDKSIPAGKILDFTREIGGELLEDTFVFDLYQGGSIPEEKKSIGIAAIFRDREKTLTDEEVTEIHSKIVDDLVKKYDAKIRQ